MDIDGRKTHSGIGLGSTGISLIIGDRVEVVCYLFTMESEPEEDFHFSTIGKLGQGGSTTTNLK